MARYKYLVHSHCCEENDLYGIMWHDSDHKSQTANPSALRGPISVTQRLAL